LPQASFFGRIFVFWIRKPQKTMKKSLLPFAALLFLLPAINLNAQDVDFKEVSFTYTQLPMKPLRKDIKNYQSKVVLKYMEDINAAKGSYADQVKKAEDDYAKAMDNYYIQQKLADDQYNTEMEAWNKKSLAEKVLLGDKNKPQKKYVPMPYKHMPVEQKYQKSFDTDMLANKYFKLEGYTNNPANAVTITVRLLGFDSPDPELKTRQVSTAGPNKTSVTVTKYSYAIKYKHPVGYKVETAEGAIFEDYPVDMTNYSTANSQEFDSDYALKSWWASAKDGFMANLQEQIVNTNLANLQNIINSNFGYKKITYATEVGLVDEKKDYDDLKEAYAAALAGYNALGDDPTKAAAIPNIRKAVDIWEKCMKESDPENKKARIDREVTKMLMVNLMQGYMWLDEYDKVQSYFDKLMVLDPDKRNRHRAERLKDMAKDAKERWLANKM
jgi:hypothetical protein